MPAHIRTIRVDATGFVNTARPDDTGAFTTQGRWSMVSCDLVGDAGGVGTIEFRDGTASGDPILAIIVAANRSISWVAHANGALEFQTSVHVTISGSAVAYLGYA